MVLTKSAFDELAIRIGEMGPPTHFYAKFANARQRKAFGRITRKMCPELAGVSVKRFVATSGRQARKRGG